MRRPQKRHRKTVQVAFKWNDLCAGVEDRFAKPGNLLGYSLAVTSTTSLAVLSGTMPDIQETRELYRSTSFQFVPANEIYSVAAGIVSKLDKEQIETDRRLLSRIGS